MDEDSSKKKAPFISIEPEIKALGLLLGGSTLVALAMGSLSIYLRYATVKKAVEQGVAAGMAKADRH